MKVYLFAILTFSTLFLSVIVKAILDNSLLKNVGLRGSKHKKTKSGYILATVLAVGANMEDIKNVDFLRKVSKLFLP